MGALNNRAAWDNGPSWHVFVLPYIEDVALDSQINEKIRQAAAQNQRFDMYQLGGINEMNMAMYICPSDGAGVDTRANVNRRMLGSNYTGIAGSAASRGVPKFYVGRPSDSCGPINFDGILHQESKTRFKDILDGASKTALIGERWYQLRIWTAGVYWTLHPGGGWATDKPNGPIPSSCVTACKNVDARYPINANFNVVGYYRQHEPRDRPPMPPTGQKIIAFNDLPYGSLHKVGATFCYADGSTHFLNDEIDPVVLTSIASRNGMEQEHAP
jgi:hypothetical protein